MEWWPWERNVLGGELQFSFLCSQTRGVAAGLFVLNNSLNGSVDMKTPNGECGQKFNTFFLHVTLLINI